MGNSSFILAHAEGRKLALQAVQEAPEGYSVKIAPPTRTLPENSLLHALIDEIARTLEWAGKKRSAETWKRLLVAAWCRTRGESVEILPALDGHGVDIVPARTSALSKADCSDLIEYIYAYGSENSILWHAKNSQA
jgi:hypothetical protein